MKKIRFKILYLSLLFLTFFMGLTSVFALDINASLVSSKQTVNPGDTFTISIKLSGLEANLASANYNVSYDSNIFTFVSITELNGLDYNPTLGVVKLGYAVSKGGIGNGVFVTMTFSAKASITSDTSGFFTLTSKKGSISDILDNDLNSNNTGMTVNVKYLSGISTLDDLMIDNISIPGFSSNTMTYKYTTTSSNVAISVTPTTDSVTVKGLGNKELSCGINNHNIVVTAENGNSSTYKIAITRNCSDDNSLKSLTVTGISFNFERTTTTYNLQSNNEKVNIAAVANDNTAKISGDVGTKNLNYGNNTFTIKVTSEKGSVQVYTLNIVRNDLRSANNNLASLSLSSGDINFKASTTTYNISVDKNVDSVTIDATLADSSASFEESYGPRSVKLKNGNNTILIKVRNERNELKTYTLNISKADDRDNNANLKYLKLSNGTIEFNKNITNYKLTVDNDVKKIKVEAEAESSKASVKITNPKLKVGNNKIKVLVTAENGLTKQYVITVIKKEANAILSDDNYLASIDIENYNIDFDKNKTNYTLNINENEESLIIKAYPSNENSSVTIIGNENLEDGSTISIKVIAENEDVREYQIDIQKKVQEEPDSNVSIPIICVIAIVVILLITIIIIVVKKKIIRNK